MSYERNHLLYDYYNFPEEMYRVQFESKGSSEVASRIVELLKQVPLVTDSLILEWDFDKNVKTRTRT